MTPQQIEAMKLALDLTTMHHTDDGYAALRAKVRCASKEALAQPEQEPVASKRDRHSSKGTSMTPQQIEAMKMALEALEYALNKPMWNRPKMTVAITALEEALAQPEQEPVIDKSAAKRIATALGWTPQRKPLTDEEISEIAINNPPMVHEFARAIEAAHGIKENT